jgi:hypothetical protein
MQVHNAAPPGASRVVLGNLPPIASQGTPTKLGAPGSCEAQSFGYCLGAYTAARLPDGSRRWSAADPQNQPSAAWLYQWAHNRQNKQCPKGSQAVPYATELVTNGAPSTARFPYNANSETTVPAICQEIERIDTANPGPDAMRLAIGSYKSFKGVKGKKDQYLDLFKSLLADGNAIAFSGLVPKGYGKLQPELTDGVYMAPNGFTPGSGHGQVIVGYDDNKGPHGAFLVQNSFSPDWNPGPADDPGYNGRVWYGYNAWFNGQSLALTMFSNNPSPPSGERLAAGSGAPPIFVTQSKTYQQDGQGYLALILHASDAFTLSQIVVTGPHGLATTQALNETLRFGYVYVQRGPAFQAGRYQVQLTGQHGGNDATWNGSVQVS